MCGLGGGENGFSANGETYLVQQGAGGHCSRLLKISSGPELLRKASSAAKRVFCKIEAEASVLLSPEKTGRDGGDI